MSFCLLKSNLGGQTRLDKDRSVLYPKFKEKVSFKWRFCQGEEKMTDCVYVVLGKFPEWSSQAQFSIASPLFSQCNAHGLLLSWSSLYVRRACRGGNCLSRAGTWSLDGGWLPALLFAEATLILGGTAASLGCWPSSWYVITPSAVPTVGLLCSSPGIPIHCASVVASKVLVCLRLDVSYSTYNSQTQLHLHRYRQRNHW